MNKSTQKKAQKRSVELLCLCALPAWRHIMTVTYSCNSTWYQFPLIGAFIISVLSSGTIKSYILFCFFGACAVAITEVGMWGEGAAAAWHTDCPPALSAHHSETTNKTLALLSRVKMPLCNMLHCRCALFLFRVNGKSLKHPYNSKWNWRRKRKQNWICIKYIAESWVDMTPKRDPDSFTLMHQTKGLSQCQMLHYCTSSQKKNI